MLLQPLPVEAPAFLRWLRWQPLARFRRMPTVFDNPDALLAAVGTDLGASEWITIEQDRIDGSRTPPVITSGSMSTR